MGPKVPLVVLARRQGERRARPTQTRKRRGRSRRWGRSWATTPEHFRLVPGRPAAPARCCGRRDGSCRSSYRHGREGRVARGRRKPRNYPVLGDYPEALPAGPGTSGSTRALLRASRQLLPLVVSVWRREGCRARAARARAQKSRACTEVKKVLGECPVARTPGPGTSRGTRALV